MSLMGTKEAHPKYTGKIQIKTQGNKTMRLDLSRGFIKVFNRRATEFDTRAKNWQGPEGLDP